MVAVALNILTIVIVIATSVVIIYNYVKFFKHPTFFDINAPARKQISVEELGTIEGGLKNLFEVIIIADNIEEPTGDLLLSVRKNLKKGVNYKFLLSKSKAEQERKSHLRIFQVMAEILHENDIVHPRVEAHALTIEWENYPFVFYRYYEDQSQQLPKAFAYMGTEKKEGIADNYELISPKLSLSILNFALEGISRTQVSPIEETEVYNATPIIQLTKTA